MKKYSVWYHDFDGKDWLFVSDVEGYKNAQKIMQALLDNNLVDKARIEEE